MRTETISLAAALLLHAALLAARWIVPTRAAEVVEPPIEMRTIDIDSLEVPKAHALESPPLPEQALAAATERRTGLEPRRAAPATGAGSPEPSSTEPVTPTPEPTTNPNAPPAPGPDHYSGPPEDNHGVFGVPGVDRPIWAIPGMIAPPPPPTAAPTEAPKPRPVDKDIAGSVLREALRSNDKEKGIDLPAAGAVASSVQQAIYSSDIPDGSRGSIEVRLGPDGKVLSVRASSFTGGSADQWERAAQAAAALLRSKKLAMTEAFAKGGTVYLTASCVSQLPSGSSSAIRPSGLGASFDLSDIGAHARRVVKMGMRAVPSR